MCKLASVMNMKESKEVLGSIFKTARMGQTGIRSVLEKTIQPGLRHALESQLREYDAIETEAHAIATSRGWELPEPAPAAGFLAGMTARMRLNGRDTDSKIADMMIQGNTKGLIQGIKNRRRLENSDGRIRILTQKLLDCETANIRQMEPFL